MPSTRTFLKLLPRLRTHEERGRTGTNRLGTHCRSMLFAGAGSSACSEFQGQCCRSLQQAIQNHHFCEPAQSKKGFRPCFISLCHETSSCMYHTKKPLIKNAPKKPLIKPKALLRTAQLLIKAKNLLIKVWFYTLTFN